jgi:hypothetical protein
MGSRWSVSVALKIAHSKDSLAEVQWALRCTSDQQSAYFQFHGVLPRLSRNCTAAETAPSDAPPPSLALLGSSRLCKIAQLDRDLRCPKRKAPAGGWGARGAGAFDLRDKTHPVTAGIMFDRRIGSPP